MDREQRHDGPIGYNFAPELTDDHGNHKITTIDHKKFSYDRILLRKYEYMDSRATSHKLIYA